MASPNQGYQPRKLIKGGRHMWKRFAYEIFFSKGASGLTSENVRDAIYEVKTAQDLIKAVTDAVTAGAGLSKILSSTVVDMKTVAAPVLYTVPTGKIAVVTQVVVRTPTASLAGGTDYDIGDKAGANFFKATNNLSTMTALTSYMVITAPATVLATYAAAAVFVIDVITGSTLAANATVEVIGYTIDA